MLSALEVAACWLLLATVCDLKSTVRVYLLLHTAVFQSIARRCRRCVCSVRFLLSFLVVAIAAVAVVVVVVLEGSLLPRFSPVDLPL